MKQNELCILILDFTMNLVTGRIYANNFFLLMIVKVENVSL
jgi:hypothetical protein